MIRIDLTRQNINHPDHRKRHPSQASCEVGGRRYETTGPGLIYKLSTLLWLHGHGGEEYQVWDDRDPFGNHGGLALHGQARNWARLVKGKLSFERRAAPTADFVPDERKAIAHSAGMVTDLTGGVLPAVGQARTARFHLLGGPKAPIRTRKPFYGRCLRPGNKGRLMGSAPPRTVVSWKGPGEPIILTLCGPDGEVAVSLLPKRALTLAQELLTRGVEAIKADSWDDMYERRPFAGHRT